MAATRDQLAAENEALRQQIAAMQSANVRRITYKVSEKGAVSVYGLNARFPVTLYADQWARLLDPANVEGLRGFIAANDSALARKG